MTTKNEIVKNALAHASARNAVSNAKFKVVDRVRADQPYGLPGMQGIVKSVGLDGDLMVDFGSNGIVRVPQAYAVINAAPMSAHEASVLLSGKRRAVTQYSKVEPNTLYYRALGHIFAVPDSDTMKAAIEAVGSRVLPYQVGGIVGNAVA